MSSRSYDGPPPRTADSSRCWVPGDPVVESTRDQGRLVHIPLGAICNNNCVFCVEDDRQSRRRINSTMRGDRVTSILEQHAGADEVCFTSGEPTLHPELALFVRQARELGYPRISVITNGRRLAYQGYASQLVRAGLNRIYISIHGHEASLHDGLTRTPESFEQTAAGLDAMAALRSRGVSVHTSTVLTTRNTPFLLEIYEFLLDRGVDRAAFHALQVSGRAARFVDRIVPRYADVRASFQRLIDQAHDHGERASLVDVPLCMTHGLPDRNRGLAERFAHFDVAGRTSGTPQDATADLQPSDREFAPACAPCAYRPACPGVYRAYAAHFGWSELAPVAAEAG